MKTLSKIAVGVVTLTLLSLSANAQTPATEQHHSPRGSLSLDHQAVVKPGDKSEAINQQVLLTNAQQETSAIPDIGTVTGTNYANKYFGLTLTIPSGWSVQDSDSRKQMNEKGKELITSDDPAKKSELARAVDSTLNLLTVAERPFGSPSNSMFICGAERPQFVKTDADYMLALKNTLKYAQIPITIEKDVYSEQIGGVAFSVIDFNTNYSGTIVKERYFAHVVKNYVLFFIMIYQTDEQLKTQTVILKSAVLR